MVLKEDLKYLVMRSKSILRSESMVFSTAGSMASSFTENMSWQGVMRCVNRAVRKGEILIANRPVNNGSLSYIFDKRLI